MNNYRELTQANSKKINDFSDIFFAFSASQFAEGMQKIGLLPGETDKIINIGSGGFVLKSKIQVFRDIIEANNQSRKDFLADSEGLKQAIKYELGNTEYGYTYDYTDALSMLDLKAEEVDQTILEEAISEYLADCED